MRKFKRLARTFLVLVMALTMILPPTTVLAADADAFDGMTIIRVNTFEEALDAINTNAGSENVVVYLGPGIDVEELISILEMQRGTGILKVLLAFGIGFIASDTLGWIIDGVVIFATGQSRADWVADALRAFSQGRRGSFTWVPPSLCGCGRCNWIN